MVEVNPFFGMTTEEALNIVYAPQSPVIDRNTKLSYQYHYLRYRARGTDFTKGWPDVPNARIPQNYWATAQTPLPPYPPYRGHPEHVSPEYAFRCTPLQVVGGDQAPADRFDTGNTTNAFHAVGGAELARHRLIRFMDLEYPTLQYAGVLGWGGFGLVCKYQATIGDETHYWAVKVVLNGIDWVYLVREFARHPEFGEAEHLVTLKPLPTSTRVQKRIRDLEEELSAENNMRRFLSFDVAGAVRNAELEDELTRLRGTIYVPPEMNTPFMALEFLKLGNLHNAIIELVARNIHLPSDILWEVWYCMVSGLADMEYPTKDYNREPQPPELRYYLAPPLDGSTPGSEMVHFDIDPKNVLIGSSLDVLQGNPHNHPIVPVLKIGDFGRVEKVNEGYRDLGSYLWRKRNPAKHHYVTPEQFTGEWDYIDQNPNYSDQPHETAGQYTWKTNLWQAAMASNFLSRQTMATLITRKNPPSPPTPTQVSIPNAFRYVRSNHPDPIVVNIYPNQRGVPERVLWTYGAHLHPGISPEMEAVDPHLWWLLMECLAYKPYHRPGWYELLDRTNKRLNDMRRARSRAGLSGPPDESPVEEPAEVVGWEQLPFMVQPQWSRRQLKRIIDQWLHSPRPQPPQPGGGAPGGPPGGGPGGGGGTGGSGGPDDDNGGEGPSNPLRRPAQTPPPGQPLAQRRRIDSGPGDPGDEGVLFLEENYEYRSPSSYFLPEDQRLGSVAGPGWLRSPNVSPPPAAPSTQTGGAGPSGQAAAAGSSAQAAVPALPPPPPPSNAPGTAQDIASADGQRRRAEGPPEGEAAAQRVRVDESGAIASAGPAVPPPAPPPTRGRPRGRPRGPGRGRGQSRGSSRGRRRGGAQPDLSLAPPLPTPLGPAGGSAIAGPSAAASGPPSDNAQRGFGPSVASFASSSGTATGAASVPALRPPRAASRPPPPPMTRGTMENEGIVPLYLEGGHYRPPPNPPGPSLVAPFAPGSSSAAANRGNMLQPHITRYHGPEPAAGVNLLGGSFAPIGTQRPGGGGQASSGSGSALAGNFQLPSFTYPDPGRDGNRPGDGDIDMTGLDEPMRAPVPSPPGRQRSRVRQPAVPQPLRELRPAPPPADVAVAQNRASLSLNLAANGAPPGPVDPRMANPDVEMEDIPIDPRLLDPNFDSIGPGPRAEPGPDCGRPSYPPPPPPAPQV
ncbi:hypothetical protein QBC35DRAFT_538917 [Podospora australis]|uniref:Protein kinase domain-containing protein n=1 Tax=Podospora australis TaxID=1536484 RepID=A0AAN6WZ84_9PEZI|nr:hypothetical protein QBC35DRAFT_538917 [Podospora australis]